MQDLRFSMQVVHHGKTFAASLIAARALLSQKKVIVFAQNFKALSENLMVAIDERLSEMTGHLGKIYKFNPNSQKFTYCKGAIYGMSYENIETCRGFTDIEVAIYDEIAIAPANLLSTVAYCLRGKNIKPRQYAMTTPRFRYLVEQISKRQSERQDYQDNSLYSI